MAPPADRLKAVVVGEVVEEAATAAAARVVSIPKGKPTSSTSSTWLQTLFLISH